MGKKAINISGDQQDAFEQAAEQVRRDVEEGHIDVERPSRGPKAGEVTDGEVLRVLAEAYTGHLSVGSE